MKLIIYILIVAGLTAFVQAGELSMSMPTLDGIAERITKHKDSQTGDPFEAKWKIHHFSAILRNDSDKTLKVITTQLDVIGPTSQKNAKITVTTWPPLISKGSQVMPAAQDLRIVEIRSGESAAIEFDVKVNVLLESLVVTYCPKDEYKDFFGYWTGSISSPMWTAEKSAEQSKK